MDLLTTGLIYCAVAGFLNRYRGNGGAWGPELGHTPKRTLVSAWLALPLLQFSPLYFAMAFISIWGLGFSYGWGAYFDFRNEPEEEVAWIDRILGKLNLNPELNDLVGMSLRGLMFTAPMGLITAVATNNHIPLLLVPAGTLMGLVYWGCYKILNHGHDRIAVSEWIWGAAVSGIYFGMWGQ